VVDVVFICGLSDVLINEYLFIYEGQNLTAKQKGFEFGDGPHSLTTVRIYVCRILKWSVNLRLKYNYIEFLLLVPILTISSSLACDSALGYQNSSKSDHCRWSYDGICFFSMAASAWQINFRFRVWWGLKSHSTLYRSFQWRFWQVALPNQQRQSSKGSQLATEMSVSPTGTTPPCYNINCRQLPPGKTQCKGPTVWEKPNLLDLLAAKNIITNQMQPQRLRDAWFSRFLRHPARNQSGFILKPQNPYGRDITTSGFWKRTAAILDLYFQFTFWPFRRRRHAILHRATKFHMTSYVFFKMAAMATQINFQFWVWWRISLPNFKVTSPVPVLLGAKLSFIEPGCRWAHSPSPSKAPGISYQGTMKTSARMLKISGGLKLLYGVSFCFCLVRFTWLCSTRWQWSFCATATPSINISPSARFATVGASSSWSLVGLWGSIHFFLFPLALPSGTWGFLLSLNHDWFACQLQRAEFLWKGSHKGPLFRMFPPSLQSIISNQMRPWRLRGAWFSHILRHPARRRSGSILSPGTHAG